MARRRVRADEAGEVPGVTNLQPLAVGGNSTIYRAWQPELDRWVAVKVLGVTLSDGRARERFLRECSAVGRLTGHPNIVTVLASGVTRTNRPFLTMDLFERGSLANLVSSTGPVPVELALRYGVKLAGALETAHRSGILHRDIKPENVLLSRFGEPSLADFGIATLGEVRGGTEAFTPTYAAPEVLDGQPATAAADVYGLASTLWTAMAGRLPFGDGADGPLKLMLRVLQEPLPPLGRPDVPPGVEEALRWAMAKEPAQRPTTAHAFGERLRDLQAEIGAPVSELVVPESVDHFATTTQPRPGTEDHPATPAAVTLRPGRDGSFATPPPGSSAAVAPAAGAPAGPGSPPPTPLPASPWAPSAGPAPAGASSVPPVGARSPAAEPTFVRPRAQALVSAPPAPPAVKGTNALAVAIVAGALLLAVALVGGAVVVTRGRGTPPPSTVLSPTSPPPSTPPTTVLPPRQVTLVAVALRDPQTAIVTWVPPTDRRGLVGYVLLHGPKDTASDTRLAINDGSTATAVVALAVPGDHCFVVESVYSTGRGATSERACS